MKRMLHPQFCRGHLADRLSILLLLGLLAVLAISVITGVRSLPL